MRFMMLVIPEGYEKAGPDFAPPADGMAAMAKYNEQLRDAGVLLSLDGLHPPVKGARIIFSGGKPQIRRGPFPEAREALGGFWMIRVGSQEEAIAWAERCPMPGNAVIEIRQVQEMEDFPEDVRKAAGDFPEKMPEKMKVAAQR